MRRRAAERPSESSTALSVPSARLHVFHGSAPRSIRFEAGRPQKLMAGSSTAASLLLEGDQIAPLHFDLYWDGAHLWLQDPMRLGRTFVNGRILNEWTAVVGHAFVACSDVRILICTKGPNPAQRAPRVDPCDGLADDLDDGAAGELRGEQTARAPAPLCEERTQEESAQRRKGPARR